MIIIVISVVDSSAMKAMSAPLLLLSLSAAESLHVNSLNVLTTLEPIVSGSHYSFTTSTIHSVNSIQFSSPGVVHVTSRHSFPCQWSRSMMQGWSIYPVSCNTEETSVVSASNVGRGANKLVNYELCCFCQLGVETSAVTLAQCVAAELSWCWSIMCLQHCGILNKPLLI